MVRFVKSRLFLSAAALALLAAAVWFAAPFFVDDPLPGVLARTPVRTWTDRNGVPLYCERTWQYEWRFDVPLSDIPPDVVALMLAIEDARFYRHGGVDYRAVFRAFWQNLLSGRIISGASTISMQVAAMDYRHGRRSALQKFAQAAKARKMERLHTKDEILEAYFNNVPYGGSIYGIEAASRHYFGLHASELTLTEASVLCGIPQRPNRYRPDRNPEAARTRQRRVLDAYVRVGGIDAAEADRLFESARLRYRDFEDPSDFARLGTAREWGFLMRGAPPLRPGDPQVVRLTVDSRLTARVRIALARRTASLKGVRDAAAVVLDVATGEAIAYVGTLDFDAVPGGQFDAAARGLRSGGSVLKPFIYYEALRGGVAVADSVMVDAPVRYAGYTPKNFDSTYRGRVSAAFALSESLNTPAVRLLAALGEGRIAGRLEELGLAAPGHIATNGLSLALGTAGYRLVDLVHAYRTLVPGRSDDIEEGARVMLSEMLRTIQLPGTAHAVAWKTGTSNNNCDAWCFAYTPEYVVGVWFGNKDGTRSESLVGARVAAPAAAEIVEMLYAGRKPPIWPMARDYTASARLCARTGAKAGPACEESFEGQTLAKIPLRLCEACARPARRVVIVSPAPREYMRADGAESVVLPLDAGRADVFWFVDGAPLPAGARDYAFAPGKHLVAALPEDPRMASASVEITVR